MYGCFNLEYPCSYKLCMFVFNLEYPCSYKLVQFLLTMVFSGGGRFYTECLGMKLLRKRDIPEERYTNAFLGYGPEDSHFVIELTYSTYFSKLC